MKSREHVESPGRFPLTKRWRTPGPRKAYCQWPVKARLSRHPAAPARSSGNLRARGQEAAAARRAEPENRPRMVGVVRASLTGRAQLGRGEVEVSHAVVGQQVGAWDSEAGGWNRGCRAATPRRVEQVGVRRRDTWKTDGGEKRFRIPAWPRAGPRFSHPTRRARWLQSPVGQPSRSVS